MHGMVQACGGRSTAAKKGREYTVGQWDTGDRKQRACWCADVASRHCRALYFSTTSSFSSGKLGRDADIWGGRPLAEQCDHLGERCMASADSAACARQLYRGTAHCFLVTEVCVCVRPGRKMFALLLEHKVVAKKPLSENAEDVQAFYHSKK